MITVMAVVLAPGVALPKVVHQHVMRVLPLISSPAVVQSRMGVYVTITGSCPRLAVKLLVKSSAPPPVKGYSPHLLCGEARPKYGLSGVGCVLH